jgi:3',5'-cyclic AMP phosphodiesterase CpdA
MADFTLRQFHHHENFILGWVGQGRVYHGREKWNTKARPIFGNPDDELIQDLGRATKRLKDQSEAANEVTRIIWAIHFPPWFESSGDNCKLIEDDRLVEKANGAGVHAVLAGHTHVHRNYKDLGMKFDVFCCGTTSQHEPSTEPRGHQARDDKAANSFQVITIDENGAGEIKITNESFKYRRMNGIAGDDELSFFETTPHAEPESDLCLPGEESDLPWRRV